MDYSRLMMGVGVPDSGGDSGGGSDNPSVEPTTKTISDWFAEPNLPQKYTESLGAPFGDRYVYTIFMQGINVLPEIPSSAEGSELTARIKVVDENTYRITEYYYIKEEGEWVESGEKTISEWTEEEESSGDTESSGGVAWLFENQSMLKIPQSGENATFNDVVKYLNEGKVVMIRIRTSLDGNGYSDTYEFVALVHIGQNGKCRVNGYRASSPTLPLMKEDDGGSAST